jgi:RES domain-containing protein
VDDIFDARDEGALKEFGMTPSDLSDPSWRDRMTRDGKAPTQEFAEALIAKGYRGLLVPSFVRGAAKDDLNLILWAWGDSRPTLLRVVDDEGRPGS